jgi:hypothetical protein
MELLSDFLFDSITCVFCSHRDVISESMLLYIKNAGCEGTGRVIE